MRSRLPAVWIWAWALTASLCGWPRQSLAAAAAGPEAARPLDPPPEVSAEEVAAAKPLRHFAGYTLKTGSSGNSHLIEGRLGVTPRFKLVASADISQMSDSTGATNSSYVYQAGFRLKPHPSHSIGASYSFGDGNLLLRARNWGLNYAFELSSLWNGSRRLEASLARHGVTYVGPNGNELLSHTSWTWGLSFELSDTLEVGFSREVYTFPSMTSLAQTYVRVLVLALALHPEVLPEEQRNVAYVDFTPGVSDRFHLEVSTTKVLYLAELSVVPLLEYLHDLSKRWEAGASVSSTLISGSSPAWTGGLTVGFRF